MGTAMNNNYERYSGKRFQTLNKDSCDLSEMIEKPKFITYPVCENCDKNIKLKLPRETEDCPKCGYALLWKTREVSAGKKWREKE